MLENHNNEFYYSNGQILSYNRLVMMIVGERGNGKTFSFKDWCIRDYIKNKNQFIWIRRYTTELEDINLFFDDITFKYPEHEFRVKGGKFYIDGEVMGYYIALSKQITKKSTPYPSVTKMIFDEFLISKSGYRYLPDEPSMLMDLYSTVARLRDVRLVMIANATSQANPYFTFFKVPLLQNRFTKVGKDIIVERTDTQEYRKVFEETRFGKLIKHTRYGAYAIHNEFTQDNHNFIEKRDSSASNIFNLALGNQIIGIWTSAKLGKMWASLKYDPSRTTYCMTLQDQQPNYLLLNSRNTHLKYLRQAVSYSYLYYEDFKVKTIMQEILKYINIK